MKRRIRRKWREREFWRGASQEDRYEYLVDSPYALDEIKQFHAREEQVLLELLKKHVEQEEDVVFIEVGCGPGRIIQKVITLVFENPSTWGNRLKFIVGIDFEMEMISRAIGGLMRRERKIRNWTIQGAAHKIAKQTKVSVKKVKESIKKRVVFVDATGEKPYLRVKGMIPVVAMMFGTLGNIRRIDEALTAIAELCWPKGEALIVVFDREHYISGIERYNQLARRRFEPLRGTVWDDEKGEFTSPAGFYSRWFFYREFKELLQRHFQKGYEITPFAKNGLFSIVKPKSTPRRVLADVMANIRNERRSPLVCLRCQACGNPIDHGTLPLSRTSELKCTKDKTHRFPVKEYMGFRIPIIEVR